MNKRIDKKWYEGVGNILTILAFISGLWPIAVVLMWLISSWEKKTKVILTVVPFVYMLIILLGAFAGKTYFSDDPQTILIQSRKIINYGSLAIMASLMLSTVLTLFSKNLEVEPQKIWKYELLLLFVVILVIIFFAMSSVGSIYSITK